MSAYSKAKKQAIKAIEELMVGEIRAFNALHVSIERRKEMLKNIKVNHYSMEQLERMGVE